MAYDRTLLAWIRTALGVIGFGFTFYKFFEYLKEHALAGGAHGHALISPRQYAILLITAGTLALIWATVQYSQAMKRIRRIDPAIPRSRTPVLAIFMTAIGLLTMIAAILRL